MPIISSMRVLRLFLTLCLLALLAGCFGDGRGDKRVRDTSQEAQIPGGPPRDVMQDGGFEPPGVPDASGGNVGGNTLGEWTTFNSNFVTSTLGPSSAPVSHDPGGAQSMIQFGVDAGAENVIVALEGDFVELTAHAMSWEPDPFNNLIVLQLSFWDAPGGRLGGGNQLRVVETFADSVGSQPYLLEPQDGAEVGDWTEMTLSAFAPAGSQSAQVLLLHVLTEGTSDAGAIYWDDVSLTSTGDAEPPPASAELAIVKTASSSTYANVGDIISYSYLVTNSGDLTISGPVSVIDNNVDAAASCPAGNLAPDASMTCTASRTVSQDDLDAGSITNVAYATGTAPDGAEVRSPTDTLTVTAAPEFQLVWSDEFDDWCGNGTCTPDPNNWTIETGYGPDNNGWGNNEWQLYTTDSDNIRVENGNLVIQARCDAGGGEPPEPPPGTEVLQDGSFEAPDASGGDVGGCAGNAWDCFNSNFIASNAINNIPPGSFYNPLAFDGTQVLKQFGGDAGYSQRVAVNAGDTVDASAYAISYTGDPFNNLAILQLVFFDATGASLDSGGNALNGTAHETYCDTLGTYACRLTPQDGDPADEWSQIAVQAVAPAGAVEAQLLLLHVLTDGTSNSGSLFWDAASMTVTGAP